MRLSQLVWVSKHNAPLPHSPQSPLLARLYEVMADGSCFSAALQQCTSYELTTLLGAQGVVLSLAQSAVAHDNPQGLHALR